jgi:hypothetical protein
MNCWLVQTPTYIIHILCILYVTSIRERDKQMLTDIQTNTFDMDEVLPPPVLPRDSHREALSELFGGRVEEVTVEEELGVGAVGSFEGNLKLLTLDESVTESSLVIPSPVNYFQTRPHKRKKTKVSAAKKEE